MAHKGLLLFLSIVLVVVVGCVPGQGIGLPGATPTRMPDVVSPSETPPAVKPDLPSPTITAPGVNPSTAPENQPDAAIKARDALARELSLTSKMVQIRQVEAVKWPDACLGAARKDEMCDQVIVPGYRVILEARGRTYEYHTNQDGTVMRTSADNSSSDVNQAVVQAVIAKAAKELNLDATAILVVKTEAVEWPDSCLGVQVKGMMCMMVITPGYRVVLEAGGQAYEYHTDQKASRIVRFMGK